VWNHAHIKDKWEKLKKKYIAKKKVGVIGNAPSKWYWFDCIGQILVSIAKVDGLLGGVPVLTPMFVDGMHVKASLFNPCIRVYC